MRILTLLSLSLLGCNVAGCKDGTATGPLDAQAGSQPDLGPVETFSGGMITPASCGYVVTERDGASTPVPGSAVFGSDPSSFGVHLGLAGDPSKSMVVTWRTRDEATLATTVQFGTGGKTDQSTDGFTFQYTTATSQNPIRIHETHLCGLQPDTAYSYRVGGKDGSGKEVWSDTYGFRTAPDRARADAQITVAFLGDSRGAPEVWGKELAKADGIAKPDLILYSGDAVLLGTLQADWDKWFEAAGDVLHRVPIVAAMGNHENNAINYFSQLALPGNEEFFSLDFGPMHLVVLNDTPSPATSLAAQAQFLDADLATSAASPWKVVMHHKPLYSLDDAHGGEQTLVATWGPIYDARKVDLVLNGHVHGYERTKPVKNMQVQATPADGTTYIVSGGAGAPLYTVRMGDPMASVVNGFNFTMLQLRAGQLVERAFKDDGTMIDTLTITKK